MSSGQGECQVVNVYKNTQYHLFDIDYNVEIDMSVRLALNERTKQLSLFYC